MIHTRTLVPLHCTCVDVQIICIHTFGVCVQCSVESIIFSVTLFYWHNRLKIKTSKYTKGTKNKIQQQKRSNASIEKQNEKVRENTKKKKKKRDMHSFSLSQIVEVSPKTAMESRKIVSAWSKNTHHLPHKKFVSKENKQILLKCCLRCDCDYVKKYIMRLLVLFHCFNLRYLQMCFGKSTK